jgi:hypothetical protein
MRHPIVKVIVVAAAVLASTAAQPSTAALSQGPCVSLMRVEQGHFAAGWVTDDVHVYLNGIERPFTASAVPVEGAGAPIDHGWSTHGLDAYENVLVGDPPRSSFVEMTPFVATVDMDLTALRGDRRTIPDFAPYTLDFNYRGEGTISDGTGLFANATGHTVTRGPFSLDFVNIDGVPVPAAFTPFGGGGAFAFQTHGMICGADVEGLGVR